MSKKNEDKSVENSYEVGYKKPPIESRFPKGKSGNPKGRPKAVKTYDEALMKELFKKITVTENGKKTCILGIEAIAKKQMNMILNGDEKMLKLFLTKQAPNIKFEDEPEVTPLLQLDEERRQQATRMILEELDRRHRLEMAKEKENKKRPSSE